MRKSITSPCQQRKSSGMIQVGVGQQYGTKSSDFDFTGQTVTGFRHPYTLKHTEIDEHFRLISLHVIS